MATCTLTNRAVRPAPSQGDRWAFLIEQGRWIEAHEVMCEERIAQTSVPDVADLASDFSAGAHGFAIDWDSLDDEGATPATGLVFIGGEDHLITVHVDHRGDDLQVCEDHRLLPLWAARGSTAE